MLEQSGNVIRTSADLLWVETIARSSCTQCSSGSCSTSVIAKLFGLKRNLMQLQNTLNADVGDRVVVGISDAVLVRASVWAYLLPLLAMLAACLLAVAMGAADALQALSALLGLLAGFFIVRKISAKKTALKTFAPQLLRVEGRGQLNVDFTDLHKTSRPTT